MKLIPLAAVLLLAAASLTAQEAAEAPITAAAEGSSSNVALVCESGRIYSFLISEQPGQPQLIERIESTTLIAPLWKRMHEKAASTFTTWGAALFGLLLAALLLK